MHIYIKYMYMQNNVHRLIFYGVNFNNNGLDYAQNFCFIL